MVKKLSHGAANKQSTEDRKNPRKRDRERTQFDLQQALQRLQKRGEKITLAAVSKEAGVSPALIHNRYFNFAEELRVIIGKGLRKQRDDKASELRQAKERVKELNQLVITQNDQITKLASINEMLVKEMAIQRAMADGKVARGHFGRK